MALQEQDLNIQNYRASKPRCICGLAGCPNVATVSYVATHFAYCDDCWDKWCQMRWEQYISIMAKFQVLDRMITEVQAVDPSYVPRLEMPEYLLRVPPTRKDTHG